MNGGNRLYKFSVDELRQLMYLCHEFDDARGFADVTRRLSYEHEGHIAEKNPTRFRHLHLQQRTIGKSTPIPCNFQSEHPKQLLMGSTGGLNAARGNLKSKIHQGIYTNRRFLASGCSCKKDGFFAYELALDKAGVWPLEEVLTGKYQLSIQKVLDGLRNFEYDPPNQTCSLCKEDFGKTVVRPTVNSTQHSFDGLCLDWDGEARIVTMITTGILGVRIAGSATASHSSTSLGLRGSNNLTTMRENETPAKER